VQQHIEAYASMPASTWAPLVRSKIATATHAPMANPSLEAYVRPWLGEHGQAANLRLVEQIDDDVIASTHAALERLTIPARVIWGEEDSWLPVEQAESGRRRISDADLHIVPGGGHFLPEDPVSARGRAVERSISGAHSGAQERSPSGDVGSSRCEALRRRSPAR